MVQKIKKNVYSFFNANRGPVLKLVQKHVSVNNPVRVLNLVWLPTAAQKRMGRMRRNFNAHHVYVTNKVFYSSQLQPITVYIRVKSADS